MAKFDPFLSLDRARVEGVGAQSKERKGSNFAAQQSGAIVQKPKGPNIYNSKNLATAIWQPCHLPTASLVSASLICRKNPFIAEPKFCWDGILIVTFTFSEIGNILVSLSFSCIKNFFNWLAHRSGV